MQEVSTTRKRASLFQQKPDRWSEGSHNKSRKQHRRRRPDAPAYDLPIDSTFTNVDVIHPHIPAMKDDGSSPATTRRRSGESPKRTQSSNHDRRSSTQDARYSSSASDFDDYLEPDDDDDEEAGLTHEERKKKRKWIWRNMRLDGRVAGDGHGSSSGRGQATMWSAEMIRANALNALFIGLWYTFSIGISVYNTWMFSKGGLHFPFPLFTTCAHMVVQFILSGSVLFFLPQFRPKAGPGTVSAHGYSHLEGDEDAVEKPPSGPVITRWFYISRIGPCGAATALDIGLGNFSLRYISLTFYTMCKSSVLAFVLLFAFLFRLEKPSWKLGAIIAIMTVGVIMMVAGEVDFQLTGFFLIMSAALCSGFRWSITQILLLRNSATSNPFSSIFFLTPVMFLCLLALAIPIEGLSELVTGFQQLALVKGYLSGVAIMMAPGVLAFMMVASEFALLKRTSVVTLSVCGIFKEVLTIATAANTFGDQLSPVNISGLFVTIIAIAAYNWLKYQKMRQEFEKSQKGIAMQDVSSDDAREGASNTYEADYDIHTVGAANGHGRAVVDDRDR